MEKIQLEGFYLWKPRDSSRVFLPRFRRLETRSLSHFRSRLVASLIGPIQMPLLDSSQLVAAVRLVGVGDIESSTETLVPGISFICSDFPN